MKLKIINGPNLNMLGVREPDVYGTDTLEKINSEIEMFAHKIGIKAGFFQSNVEGEIVSEIQKAFFDKFDGIILNAGGYTHTSVAIRDAISSVDIPCVEVHLSNIYGREEFRAKSIIAPVCIGQITGFGKNVYKLAILSFMDVSDIKYTEN
ncbi:MAG: type II 3-dehydroquinate dehydratase [Abditibacteriota bacterium]|nr:type II 3-dehydroquinate dehydratase [Abditibacteriota bacterium]